MANEYPDVTLHDLPANMPRSLVMFDPEEPEDRLKQVAGSRHASFNQLVIGQLIACSGLSRAEAEEYERGVNALASGVSGIKPADEVEGMLAVQMVGVHMAAMRALSKGQYKEASTLSRTYLMLLEGLDKHRGKGRQQIQVEHVHVNEGGQAIVGNVKTGKKRRRKHEKEPEVHQGLRVVDVQKTIEYKAEIPMQCEDAQWAPVPVAAGDGEEALPDARRRAG